MVLTRFHQFRGVGCALVDGPPAAVPEGAASREADQIRRLALNGVEFRPAGKVQSRNRPEQAYRIRVARVGIDLTGVSWINEKYVHNSKSRVLLSMTMQQNGLLGSIGKNNLAAA